MNNKTVYYQELFYIADCCRFLAAVLNTRPTAEFVAGLRSANTDGFVPVRTSTDKHADGADLIVRYIRQTRTRSPDEVAESLAVDWTRIFRGVAPGYGPCPPYEAMYAGDDSQECQANVMSAVLNAYADAGLVPGNGYSRPDYAGIQLAFLHYLCSRELECLTENNPSEAARFRQQYKQFSAEHLGQWIARYCLQAERFAQTDFYRGVLRYLPEFVGLRHDEDALVSESQ